ncbi:chorismate-binding protein [Flavobacterium sp. xlx-214]|uniref:chorismate-binding protein n=1 Tax=unclassified Flavobacterium TaxID=196869 RepID=UPI0013D41C7F|nr:chorismate-binding protein [Flavobacterium sp. xlx-214]MBA5793237.1 chorismate-binding protein [Flavobacterium sp. xlx-221]QMI82480.1 chorismate-binding protein [Flavobacterium sp. xlx-214]
MIKTFLQKALKEQLPFVLYRKPNETLVNGWFQKTNTLDVSSVLNKSCFVFAPFVGEDKVVFYPENCDLFQEDFSTDVSFSSQEIKLESKTVNKDFHIQLVQKGIDTINEGVIQKIVLSRKEEVTIDAQLYETYFNRFLKKYPTAFVYWWFHPKVGMWMGATPEQLLKINNNKVQTVALAGTMVADNNDLNTATWGLKEIEEQNIVTLFIVNGLSGLCKEIHQSKPYTFKAGTLLHIKTDIEAELLDESSKYKVVDALHPTPALCGFPKDEARKFIVENEGYAREYYGGYLGEWQIDNLDYANKTDLFVNLRCMKISNNKAFLFLGGGVNKDSDPESEYYETVNKSKTVKSIL